MDRRDFIKLIILASGSILIPNNLIADEETKELNLNNYLDKLSDEELGRIYKEIGEKIADDWWRDMMKAEKEYFTKCQN